MNDTTTIDPKTPRNAQCPCGSGNKFKRCHGAADAVEQAVAQDNRLTLAVTGGAVVVSIVIGAMYGGQTGLGVFAAAAIGIGAWVIFRDPPPPKAGGGDPAAINFGK